MYRLNTGQTNFNHGVAHVFTVATFHVELIFAALLIRFFARIT